MGIFLALPILSLAAILQSAVVSRVPLLGGTADLMLLTILAWAVQERVTTGWQWAIIGGLMIDFMSGLPFGIFTASYLVSIALTLALRKRVWRFSILVYLLMVVFGTLISHLLSIGAVFLRAGDISILNMLQTISLPSLILNMALSIPVFILVQELAWQVYPEEIKL